jgi:DNA-binding NarL/FixJ family response regulator
MNVAVFSRFFLSRKSLCSLLKSVRDVEVVLDSENVLECIEQIAAACPDILLIDSEHPNDDLGTVRQVSRILPHAKIVLLLGIDDQEFELRAFEAGARGCVSKKNDMQILLKALTLVRQGQFWISREVASLVAGKLRGSLTPEQDASRELTEREWEILALLGIGYVNKDISRHLAISENTVKTHLASIYRKLQVNTRLGAVLHYFRRSQQLSKPAENGVPSAPGPVVAPIAAGHPIVAITPDAAAPELPRAETAAPLQNRDPRVPLKAKQHQA